MKDSELRLAGHKPARTVGDDVDRLIQGSIVDGEQLEIGEGLTADRTHRPGDGARRVAAGHDYAEEQSGSSSLGRAGILKCT